MSADNQSLSFVRPALHSLLISHSFLVLLFPLVIALFCLSGPQSRRRIVFLLNLTGVSIAFVVAILIDVTTFHTILDPLNPLPITINIAIGFIGVWQSIVVDLTLLVRLVSVYPPRNTGLMRFGLLIAIPVLLKLARVVNIIIFTVVMTKTANGPNGTVMAGIVFETKPYLKVEWATQMIDNTYASLAFLWRIRNRENKPVAPNSSSITLAQRIRTLFYIAATNFVIPTMFSIAQFISVYHGVSSPTLNQLILVNTMLATFGVTFATIWAINPGQEEGQDKSRLAHIFEFGSARGPHQSSALETPSSWYTKKPDE